MAGLPSQKLPRFNTDIVGYTTKGEPIDKQQLREKVKSTSKKAKQGDVIPHRDVVKESETW